MTSTLSRLPLPRLGLIVLLCAAPPFAVAVADPVDDDAIVIVGDDAQFKLTLDDGVLVIATDEDGHVTTAEIDMTHLSEMVSASLNEAMAGLGDMLDNLDEMQLQMRLGEDNRLNVEYDDREFELDLDQIVAQVSAAVELGLAEIDVDRWSHCRPRGSEPTEDELREELHNLQQEMKELRRELKRLRTERSE